MYAIVHEDAIRCEGPNGEEYDRVKVLQDLGYHVNIAGSPFGPYQIQDRFLRESLDELAFKELIRLYAFDYNWHRIVGKFLSYIVVCPIPLFVSIRQHVLTQFPCSHGRFYHINAQAY